MNTSKKIIEYVDEAYELSVRMKADKERYDFLKGQIKAHAMQKGIKKVAGLKGIATFTDGTESTIAPAALYDLIEEKGLGANVFFSTIKVSLTEAKKQLGMALLDPILKVVAIPYFKMTMKKAQE